MTAKDMPPIPAATETIASGTVDSAFKAHTSMGSGLLESVYEKCFIHELTKRGIVCESQINVPILYDGMRIESGLRVDLLIEKTIVLELKTVNEMNPFNESQILNYQKLLNMSLGVLINFNVAKIKDGIRRMIL